MPASSKVALVEVLGVASGHKSFYYVVELVPSPAMSQEWFIIKSYHQYVWITHLNIQNLNEIHGPDSKIHKITVLPQFSYHAGSFQIV